ncbi:MAG: [protein-PII] uridylyltransferase [Thermodesulfobacteriota bacterium]|nr:[protein-PII] uridylyltransferase [Thermodesulfobacteriota bacterium]
MLQKEKERLITRFLKGKEPTFLERHAGILDDYFRESYTRSAIGPQIRVDKNPYALIALGGYGRKEQCIHSDVDLLLLFKKTIPEEAKGLIQEVFYPLWDMGLDVSYAIRSLKECSTLASQDFEVLTSLFDARFLCGISSPYSDLMDRLRDKVLGRRRRAYIDWLAERNKSRHARFGDSTYLLEPNLKEGHGGLRDYHAMLWVARALYDIGEPRDLEFFGHLSHDEFNGLDEALSFIRMVRNWLHHLSGRKCDQLYFEYQIKLARSLGFRQENGQQGVERFLGTLHGQMDFLKHRHLAFLGKAASARKKPGRKKAPRRVLTRGIEVVQDCLEFESPEAILENPHLLIGIFEKSALRGHPLTAGASRLVKEFLHLIDDQFRGARKVVKSFEQILAAPNGPSNVLNELLNTGMMAALIPEMEGITNRIQYDEYHVHPVDKHSLRTVQTLKEFRDAETDGNESLCEKLFSEIGSPRLLLWAGLFHDIGKAEDDHDHHCAKGAEIVTRILKRMAFPDTDVQAVSFLVLHHLLLVHTATRRDINDEKVVVQCARNFPDIEHLNMLYLLTVADSKATGPKAWNDWKAALLKELYSKVYHVLKTGELATPAAADVIEKKRKAVFQGALSMPERELEALFDHLSPRYLLYMPPQDMVRHMALYHRLGQSPFVLEVETSKGQNYRTATICAKDFPGLFSTIAGVFTLNNVQILSAQIYTWRNHIALDIFQVKAPPDTILEDDTWARVNKDMKAALAGELALPAALDQKGKAYKSAQRTLPKQTDKVQTDKIIVDNESSDFFTVIEIHTHDSLGLLYKITSTLFHLRLDIWVAKIATKVDQVVDVFYVRDFDGQKVDNPEEVAGIKEEIKEALATC